MRFVKGKISYFKNLPSGKDAVIQKKSGIIHKKVGPALKQQRA